MKATSSSTRNAPASSSCLAPSVRHPATPTHTSNQAILATRSVALAPFLRSLAAGGTLTGGRCTCNTIAECDKENRGCIQAYACMDTLGLQRCIDLVPCDERDQSDFQETVGPPFTLPHPLEGGQN
jgi:hypothetical protein